MGDWKSSAKQDGVRSQGPQCRQKSPAPGVMPGTGGVGTQMNPRRERREDYDPQPQPRESGVRIGPVQDSEIPMRKPTF